MNYKIKRVLSFILTAVLVLGISMVSGKAVNAASGDVTITLLETTDLHGHMVEVTNLDDSSTNQYRLAYMAKIFEDLRNKGNVILLNGGDSFQGTPVSDFSYGKYVIDAMNKMQYDASTLGNHEFDWGLDAVTTENGTYLNSKMPVLACNIFYAGTTDRIPNTKDYTIIQRDGKKVAVIGWAEEYSADIMAAKIQPYTISQDVRLVNDLAKKLKDSKEADAVIVLAHAAAEDAAELFDAKYVDFLLGGHSHKINNGVAKSGIAFAQANCYGYGYTSATMTIKADGSVAVGDVNYVTIYDKKNLTNLLNSKENAANLDQRIVKICDDSIAAVAPKLNEKIANLPVELSRTLIDGSLTSNMGNFITDMLLNGQEGVDFAFCNDGGIRCNFDAKQLTAYDIYTVSPFNNLMYKVEMTGAQVVKLLEQIVGNDSSNMQMSGLTAKYDLSRKEDDQIFDVRLADGTPIDLNKTYTLMTNEYIATGGNKYSVFLTDVISKFNTNELDNETILASVRELGKKGDLQIDSNPRLVAGTMQVPTTQAKASVYVGSKVQLVSENATGGALITYSSDKKKVATVNEKGEVTGKKAGKATITSTVVLAGRTYELKTVVTVKTPSIKFGKSAKTIKLGDSFNFTVKLEGLSGDVNWTSSKAKVAVVNKNGKVTSKKTGKTTITAKVGKYSVSQKVKVCK